jgi:2-oxoglutarate dehydrogenase E2 component (dihydrolipoamide succinyltransferase)/2-oxoisovalerate dehydrogenase E2 component (dihydrolipoyl transacylase)
VAEGTVIEWLKREGDRVRKDEAVLAISTEKVDAEIPAPTDGVLSSILVRAGESAPVGSILAVMTEGGESATETGPGTDAAISTQPGAPGGKHSAPRVEPRGERFYSPAVRRLADELEVNLAEVTGTGEDGRVTKRDVETFSRGRRRPLALADTASTAHDGDGEELLPLTRMRRAIAENTLRSLRETPTVTSVAEADFTVIARYRERKKAAFREAKGTPLTFLPFLVKATAHLLPEFPTLNARWSEEGIHVRRYVHLGIAVALADGLVVPVLRSPATLSVSAIAVRIADLAHRAQEGRLLPHELTGGTFTVNNFGADGNLIGTPVLNRPEVGILGVGTIGKRVAVVSQGGEDALAIRWTGYLCLSYDHRAVDGAVAGRFLQRLRRLLDSFTPNEGIWSDPFLQS